MDKIISLSYDHALADYDVQKIAPNARVMLYKYLSKFEKLEDAIGPSGRLILLFPTHKESDNNGHWISLLYKPEKKLIEHFDSYGLSPQAEIAYSQNDYVVKDKLLNNLISDFLIRGGSFQWNTTRLQEMKTGMDDCGRWASLRCRFHYLSNPQFCKMFLNQHMSPDWLACCLTFVCAKDEKLERERILGLFQ